MTPRLDASSSHATTKKRYFGNTTEVLYNIIPGYSCMGLIPTCLGLAALFLLLFIDLPLLVEDLLGLSVADEEDNGGKDKDNGAPGATVAESEGVDVSAS